MEEHASSAVPSLQAPADAWRHPQRKQTRNIKEREREAVQTQHIKLFVNKIEEDEIERARGGDGEEETQFFKREDGEAHTDKNKIVCLLVLGFI